MSASFIHFKLVSLKRAVFIIVCIFIIIEIYLHLNSLCSLEKVIGVNIKTENKSSTTKPELGLGSNNVLSSSKSDIKEIKVLFWTEYYGKYRHPDNIFGLTSNLESCLYKMRINCTITLDRKTLNESHAIVFHSGDRPIANFGVPPNKNEDLPKYRQKWQPWVHMTQEPPAGVRGDVSGMGLFNWSMSYRLDSDIFHPYYRTIDIEPTGTGQNDLMKKKEEDLGKLKLIAWTFTNPETRSKRSLLAEKLSKYVPIDIYGGHYGTFSCGGKQDQVHPDSCMSVIGGKYKFYLAFENSLCTDYMTEKPFNALLHSVVPIVFGWARYDQLLPPHSYIDVRNFNSVKELGDYILHLDKNPKEYLEYFQWKRHYKIVESDGWCSLCRKLAFKDYPPHKSYHPPNKEYYGRKHVEWPHYTFSSGLLRELGFIDFNTTDWNSKNTSHPECIE